MENSSSFSDLHLPVRSISLPTRVHPTSVKLESALNHLKTWQISSPVIGAEMLQNGLAGLAEMYSCIEEFISSSTQTQQALICHENGQLLEEAFDKSITLIDTCSSSRDLLLMMKENMQTLQSALRRRRDSLSIENEISCYITFRKKMNKDISKSLQALKKLESKNKTTILSNTTNDHDQHVSFTIKVLSEATAITISIFRSLLIFVSMSTSNKMKLGGWSLISKLMKMRPLSSSSDDDHQKIIKQVESVDFAVYSLHGSCSRSSNGSNSDKASEVNMTQKMLQGLNVSIKGLETGVDSMFKCLIQNRVSFLNILTN
ncbi:hypothetical protein Ddye_009942 [Dipteronia dyeriana]|uniref:Uncharacterized protein n=1 Tax=Dipteronia dyeriana TaxID=168575 RepID=A0AAE0CMP2_9ROSI|nr:hypothetical protein Ddye_009942 [Dipteronia dyeriana]